MYNCISFCTIAAYDRKLFTLSMPKQTTILTTYKTDLKIEEICGQNDQLNPYYFLNESIVQFEINGKYFIFLQLNSETLYFDLVLMDRNNGNSKYVDIHLWDQRISAILINHILVYDESFKSLHFFDIDGKLLDSFNIGIFPKKTQLMDGKNGFNGLLFLAPLPEKLVFVF